MKVVWPLKGVQKTERQTETETATATEGYISLRQQTTVIEPAKQKQNPSEQVGANRCLSEATFLTPTTRAVVNVAKSLVVKPHPILTPSAESLSRANWPIGRCLRNWFWVHWRRKLAEFELRGLAGSWGPSSELRASNERTNER